MLAVDNEYQTVQDMDAIKKNSTNKDENLKYTI